MQFHWNRESRGSRFLFQGHETEPMGAGVTSPERTLGRGARKLVACARGGAHGTTLGRLRPWNRTPRGEDSHAGTTSANENVTRTGQTGLTKH